MNTDFIKTSSYTPRLIEYSKYYKTFSNVLQVRTISAEYLVAMKLMAGRKYKNDLSDIVGILLEHNKRDEPLYFDDVKKAIIDLYDSYEKISSDSRLFIELLFEKNDLQDYYLRLKKLENENSDVLIEFQKDYPGVLNGNNIENVLKIARERLKKEKMANDKHRPR